MKRNIPITQHEVLFAPDQLLVTKTDLKGAITFANEDFIEVCGYSRDELLGRSQNIVRHPDMPQEVFFDLWQTLKSGQSWRGIVKNRTKDGDYYWVKTLVSPIREQDQIIGYMAVRSRPERAEIQRTADYYRGMLSGQGRYAGTGQRRSPEFFTRLSWLALPFSVMALSMPFLPLEFSLLFGLSLALGIVAIAWLYRRLVHDIQLLNQRLTHTQANSTKQPLLLKESLLNLEASEWLHQSRMNEILLSARAVAQRGDSLFDTFQLLDSSTHHHQLLLAQMFHSLHLLREDITQSIEFSKGSMSGSKAAQQALHHTHHALLISEKDAATLHSATESSRAPLHQLSEWLKEAGALIQPAHDAEQQSNLLSLSLALEHLRLNTGEPRALLTPDAAQTMLLSTSHVLADLKQTLRQGVAIAANIINGIQALQQSTQQEMLDMLSTRQQMEDALSYGQEAMEHVQKTHQILGFPLTASHDLATRMHNFMAQSHKNRQILSDINASITALGEANSALNMLLRNASLKHSGFDTVTTLSNPLRARTASPSASTENTH